jgi:hypothetical protein
MNFLYKILRYKTVIVYSSKLIKITAEVRFVTLSMTPELKLSLTLSIIASRLCMETAMLVMTSRFVVLRRHHQSVD